jgi:broad specificity phosphatase PhoE
VAQVLLVRHAMPEVRPDVPAERWRRGDEGPHEAVVERFDAAVRAGLAASQAAPLIVVDHGQALTLWLHSVGAVDDAPGFWSQLAFPDAWTVSVRWSDGALVADAAPVRVG